MKTIRNEAQVYNYFYTKFYKSLGMARHEFPWMQAPIVQVEWLDKHSEYDSALYACMLKARIKLDMLNQYSDTLVDIQIYDVEHESTYEALLYDNIYADLISTYDGYNDIFVNRIVEINQQLIG